MVHNAKSASPSRPKVAMVVAGDKFGGAERQLLTLCAAAGEHFEPVIFQTLAGPLSRTAESVGLPVRRELLGRSLISSGRALAKILRDEHFDLVHTHGYRSSTLAALAMTGFKRLPVVRTVHGAPEPLSASTMGINEAVGRLADLFTRARRVYVSRELVTKMGARKRSTVIYNGVMLDAAPGARPTGYGQKVNLVAVGRLEPVKGLPILIEALAHEALIDRVHLHLVGDGPDRAALEALVKVKKLSDSVTFHGFKANPLDYIAHADFLLLPSLHEGVPYVLLEALALKTAVIASNVGGIPEVVRNGEEAFLFEPQSVSDLQRVLRQTLPNPERIKRVREAAYRRVIAQFSDTAMTRAYASLYLKLLKRV